MALEIELIQEADWKKINLNEKLAHLSLEQINDLIRRYYEGETLKRLNADFNVKLSNTNVEKIFPPIIVDTRCPYCEIPMQRDRIARNMHRFPWVRNEPYCPKCRHSLSEDCHCKTCLRIKVEEEMLETQRKKEVIHAVYGDSYPKANETSLSLQDKIYLAALLRVGLDEDVDLIKAVSQYEKLLSPTENLTKEMILSLVENNLIKPHFDSPVDAFKDDDTFPYTYYIFRVPYLINIQPYDSDYGKMIQRLLYPDPQVFQTEKQFCCDMWKKIGLHECIQYLTHSLEKVGYDFNPGEKTITMFLELLERFSVAQIYGIIYKAVANATKYQQETKISKRHASNLVITNCQRYGERAIAENWKLTHFRRDYNLPETMLHQVFFYRIIQISTLGFSETPTENF